MTNLNNSSFFRLLIVLWLALTVLPAAFVYSFFVLNFLVIMLLYAILFLSTGTNYVLSRMGLMLPIFIIPFLNNCISFGGNQPLYMFLYGLLQNMLLPLITLVLIHKQDYKNARFVIVVFLFFLFITSITTYIGNVNMPGVSRELAGIWGSDPTMGMFYKSLNIGGFDFVYTVTLSIPLLCGLIRDYKYKLDRIYFILLLGVFIAIVIKTEYGLALVFAILSLVTILFKDFSKQKFKLFIVWGGLGIFLLSTMASVFLNYFLENTSSEVLTERIGDVSSLLSGEEISDRSDVSIRQSLYEGSWLVFKQNPLIGDAHNKLIGGHSYALDVLANYGIVGLLLIIWCIRSVFTLFIKPWKNTMYYYLFVFVFMMQIGLLILNTTWIFHIFFVLIPLVGFISGTNDNKETTIINRTRANLSYR